METDLTEDKRRVLIVDDEDNIPTGILKMLGQSGKYHAVHARSGEAAQTMLGKEKFDLVITDLKMPNSKVQGIDLLRHIRSNYEKTGVIIMTAYGSTEVQDEASRRGSFLYLEKPFDFNVLQSKIDEFYSRKDQSTNQPHQDNIQGVIPGLQLMDVIQMNCLSRFSGTLHITTTDGSAQGIISFNKGNVTHSETPSRSGRDAFFEIASWKGGSFDTLEQVAPNVTIVESWEQLLMEAVAYMPETAAQSISKPKAAVKVAEQAPADTLKMLDRVMDSAKAEITFIVTHTGFVIDKRLRQGMSIDLVKSGDEISRLLPGIFSVAKTLAAGTLNEITLRYGDKTVMIRNVSQSELLFIVIAPSTVSSGEIFKAIERESENIKKIL
jgi:DNA-binding response OmpR family regulator/predicted regulator of Ras-like GTPase activity (Roadblock/LC7/MglB family)